MSLKEAREKVGLSQKGLASAVGVPYQTIQKYEAGRCLIEHMTLEMAEAYAKALKLGLDEFSRLGQ